MEYVNELDIDTSVHVVYVNELDIDRSVHVEYVNITTSPVDKAITMFKNHSSTLKSNELGYSNNNFVSFNI